MKTEMQAVKQNQFKAFSSLSTKMPVRKQANGNDNQGQKLNFGCDLTAKQNMQIPPAILSRYHLMSHSEPCYEARELSYPDGGTSVSPSYPSFYPSVTAAITSTSTTDFTIRSTNTTSRSKTGTTTTASWHSAVRFCWSILHRLFTKGLAKFKVFPLSRKLRLSIEGLKLERRSILAKNALK